MARSYPGTPLRAFRIPDELYLAAKDAAGRQGTTLAAVVVQALTELVERDRLERAWVEGLDAEGAPRVPQGETSDPAWHGEARSGTAEGAPRVNPQVRKGTDRDS